MCKIVTLIFVQLTARGPPGVNGLCAANHVVEVTSTGPESVNFSLPEPLMQRTVLVLTLANKPVILIYVLLMVSGQHGQTGRTVAKVVKMGLGPELAVATSPPLPHMVNLVLETRRKLSLATRTCVQLMVIGRNGLSILHAQ